MLSRITLPLWAKYAAITATYSLVHTIPRVWEAKFEHRNTLTGKYEQRPALFTKKAAICILSVVTGPWLWPMHATTDIARLECYIRGKNPAHYDIE